MAFAPLQLPSGRWQGGFRHAVTRKKITKTFDYSYEAEAWATIEEQRAREQAEELRAGHTPDPVVVPVPTPEPVDPGPTVTEYGALYLDRRRGELARNTHSKYGTYLRGLSIPVGAREPLADRNMGTLKKADVQLWLSGSVAEAVGVPSINARLGMLRRLFIDANADDDVPVHRDPTAGIKFLPEDQEADRVLSVDEESRLLANASPELRLAMLIAVEAGLRWSEIYALRPAAFIGDYISVSHVVERGTDTLRSYPKSKRRRVVPMTQRLADAVSPVLAGMADDALLFPNGKGHVMDYNNYRERLWGPTLYRAGFAEIGERVSRPGLRKYGPDKGKPYTKPVYFAEFGIHALRHTYGSRLAAAGVPRSEIRELMGHSDERTTERYIHAGTDGRRMELVRAALGQEPRLRVVGAA